MSYKSYKKGLDRDNNTSCVDAWTNRVTFKLDGIQRDSWKRNPPSLSTTSWELKNVTRPASSGDGIVRHWIVYFTLYCFLRLGCWVCFRLASPPRNPWQGSPEHFCKSAASHPQRVKKTPGSRHPSHCVALRGMKKCCHSCRRTWTKIRSSHRACPTSGSLQPNQE